MNPERKIARVFNILHVKKYSESDAEKLECLPGFEVDCSYQDLPSAVFDFLDETAEIPGEIFLGLDLDNAVRLQKKWELIRKMEFGKVEEYERDFVVELHNASEINPVLISDQPRDGLQAARFASRNGTRYLNFWDCFTEHGIPVFASRIKKGLYYEFGYKHQDHAAPEVGDYIIEQSRGNIAAVAMFGDKFTDMVFARDLHNYLNEKVGLDKLKGYWLRNQNGR